MNSSEVKWKGALEIARKSGLFDSERQGVSFSGRVSWVRFDVGLFRLEIYHDKLTDEVGRFWCEVESGIGIVDPIEAIFYFAAEIEPLVAEGEGSGDYLEVLAAIISVYCSNKWVFHSGEWVVDGSFKLAFGAANKWASHQARPMLLWEFERRMFLFGQDARR